MILVDYPKKTREDKKNETNKLGMKKEWRRKIDNM